MLGATLLFVHEYRGGRADLERDTVQTARALVQAVDSQMLRAQSIGEVLATSAVLASGDLATFHRRAREAVAATDLATHVALVEPDMRQVLNTGAEYGLPLPAPTDPDSVRRVLATGQAVFSNLQFSELLKRPVVGVVVPVILDGRPAYALRVGVLAQRLDMLLKAQGLPPDWVAGVFDSSGTIVARTHAAEQFVGQKAAEQLLQALGKTEAGTTQAITKEGIPVTSSFSCSSTTKWCVAIGIPRQTLLAGLIRTLSVLSAGAALLLLLSGVLARRVGNRIARSVEALTVPALALGRGDGFDVPEVSVREAADVAAALTRASGLLHERDMLGKAAEQALLRAHQRLSLAQRAARAGLWEWDLATDELGWSDELFHLFGMDPRRDRASMDAWQSVVHPQDHQRIIEAVSAAAQQRRALKASYRIVLGAGQERWIDVFGDVVEGRDGRGACMSGMCIDATEWRQAERGLAEVTATLDLAPVMVRDFDGTIRYWSKGCERLYGWTAREAVGRRAHGLLRTVFPVPLAGIEAALQREGEWTGDLHQTTRDGRVLAVVARKALRRDAQGRPLAVAEAVADVTAAREAQAELAQLNATLEQRVQSRTLELAAMRDAAEAATRAKSAFLANMSHEIRTPMNAIIGFTHLLMRDAPGAQQMQRLQKVEQAAQHLLQILNDVLDLSKIEAGKMVLEDAEFDLDAILERVVGLVREQAEAKDLELVLDTHGLPRRLRGDPTRLAQALLNLLSNAVKFTVHGWVRLRAELLRGDAAQLVVRFEVSDTGEGIASERLDALFSAFEQADASITRRHGGTGLGLALTRHIAQLMGGEVGVQSTPGQGSTFWFTACLAPASEATTTVMPIQLQGLRALVVDDLPEARSALVEQLWSLGLKTVAADSGQAAVRLAQDACTGREFFDLLLIDWLMPAMDGIATLQRLQQTLASPMPPSLLVTALDEAQLQQQARAAGFHAVLLKPVTASTLHDTLVSLLQPVLGATLVSTASGSQALQSLRSRHAGARVLLAEDNAVNQELATLLLRAASLEVVAAEDGERAVELALAHEFDAILMDMQMPRKDGLAATTAIRNQGKSGVPIIAMTANAFADDRRACLAAGMNDFLTKPVVPEMLYVTLSKWLLPKRTDHPRLSTTTATKCGPSAA